MTATKMLSDDGFAAQIQKAWEEQVGDEKKPMRNLRQQVDYMDWRRFIGNSLPLFLSSRVRQKKAREAAHSWRETHTGTTCTRSLQRTVTSKPPLTRPIKDNGVFRMTSQFKRIPYNIFK